MGWEEMGSQRGQSGLLWLNHLAPPPKTNTLRHLCVYVGVNKFLFKSFVICLKWNSGMCRNVASCVIYKKRKKTGVRCIVNFFHEKKKSKNCNMDRGPSSDRSACGTMLQHVRVSRWQIRHRKLYKCSFWKWRAREGERSHSLITVSL